MKILEINAYYNYGSTGHIVKDLCEEGIKRNHEMHAIYWLMQNKKEDPHVIFCGEANGPSNVKKIAHWIINGGKLNYNPERTERIIKEIYRIRPDIIHLHNLHGDFEYGSIDVEKLFTSISKINCKVIWTFHDCWAITGRCYYFSYMKCDRWKKGCGKCPQRWFDRQGVFCDHSADNWKRKKKLYEGVEDLTIVTVSNWLNGVVRESMLKHRRIVTVYNGIDTKTFTPSIKEKDNDKFCVLCIGWDRRKGYKDYFKLADLLSENEEIAVVGRRPFFRKLPRMPKNMRQIDRATSKQAMSKIYNEADIYFNASPAETFGLTTVEALSSGIPVVGYRNTATTELLETSGCSSYIAENGNVADVKRIIDQTQNEITDRFKLHEICENLFKHSLMIERYFAIYENN